jgi:hypothetical protein
MIRKDRAYTGACTGPQGTGLKIRRKSIPLHKVRSAAGTKVHSGRTPPWDGNLGAPRAEVTS